MDKRQQEKRTAELVRHGSKNVPVPRHIESRILSEISAASREKERKHSVIQVKALRYTPAAGLAAAALLLIPVLVIVLGSLRTGGTRVPITVVSDSGARIKESGSLVAYGGNINKNEIVVTDKAAQTGLSREDILDIQLFTETEFEITDFDPQSADLAAVLHSGSLYAHKKDKQSGSQVSISINEYDFVMTGTRISLSSKNDGYIHALCFEGTLEVYKSENHIQSLTAGKGMRIFPDDIWQIFSINDLCAGAEDLDEELRYGLPEKPSIAELEFRLSLNDNQTVHSADNEHGSGSDSADTGNKQMDPENHESNILQTALVEQKERYTIINIASIAENGNSSGFYSMATNGNQIIAVNSQSVFSLENDTVSKKTSLPSGITFKTNPVAAGSEFILPAANTILAINARNMESNHFINLPADGSIDHNFNPVFLDNMLYVPIQNFGYYSIDPDEPEPALDLVAEEKFPVSPGMIGKQLIIGSYYNNYIAGIKPEGGTAFSNSLDGNSTVNFYIYESDIYYYIEENGRYYIQRFNSSGSSTGKWELSNRVKSDFIVIGYTIFGIYTDGNLFYLDASDNKQETLAVLFENEPTSRQWRNTNLRVYAGELFCPTDYGKILIADLSSRQITDEIFIEENGKFYSAPAVLGNKIYTVSSSGTVYAIIRNEK